jgi:aminotransferase
MPRPFREEPSESVIRLMTRLAVQRKAVNLAQGFTDEAPCFDLAWAGIRAILGGTDEAFERLDQLTLREAAGGAGTDAGLLDLPLREVLRRIQSDRDRLNQYSFPFGLPELRAAIADYTDRFYGVRPDPDTEVTVVLGATEGLSTVLRAALNPGDGVIVFQPFHEMYPAQAHILGLRPVYVSLREDRERAVWTIDRDAVAEASKSARAIIINTPHNPTGKVLTEADARFLVDLCARHDLLAITDEIYEHIVYDGRRHTYLAGLEGMADRTFVINSISKTGSATGWRVGWVLSPEAFTQRVRGVHDTMVIQAPTPLQKGAERLLHLDDAFYRGLATSYDRKRQVLLEGLREVGFRISPPEGSYYLFADYLEVPGIGNLGPTEAAMDLIDRAGVAAVPGDNFYAEGDEGNRYLRFAFCRSIESLQEAVRRLKANL